MSMRNLTLLLLVFMLALLCIKHAKADDYSECTEYLADIKPETIHNAPDYSGAVPFNSQAIPAYCTCMVLSKDNGIAIDLNSITECQAITRLFEIIDI